MNMFLLHDPKLLTQCARFSHVGTWTSGVLCKNCEQPTSNLVEPLQIEWGPGSDIVCSFSWCGYVAAVKESTGLHLLERGFECNLGEVAYVRPRTDSKKKIIPYPYSGPKLNWLMPTGRIPLNEKESGVDLIVDCNDCEQRKYTFKTKGIVIDKERWLGEKLFCIEQFSRSRAMFVTEEAVAILQQRMATNIAFSEAGVIL